MAKPEIAERIDGQLAVEPSTPSHQIADPRGECEAASDHQALRSLTPERAGVQNMRDRIEDLGGTFEVASSPGHGTVLTISLPWPAAADGRR